jgi:diketogulonate reductase-like aldo/keto reductase
MKIKLNNGVDIPSVGLGTWEITGSKARESTLNALECGYRMIDTAMIYHNEDQVGLAIEESGISRENIFVTTKIWNTDHDDVVGAFNKSLDNLRLDYVDLYLIHWPSENGARLKTWETMNQIVIDGRCKSIGVSNYNIKLLDELIEKSGVIPSVNQVPISPFSVDTRFYRISHDRELIDYCNRKNITVQAYSPLTRGLELKNPLLLNLSEKYNKTPAQLLIRWGLQKGFVVIPKSQNKQRINENFNVFDFAIDNGDMETLNSF